MDFKVTIEQFDGPLDLMLHLIKENELNLFDLDILELTNQYIAYIHAMEKLQLDVASEYLVELATLIEYKSKKLLPADKSELEEDYEESKEEDLVKRLLEYQKYKEVTGRFVELFEDRSLLHDKPQAEIVNEWMNSEENYEAATPYDLIKAMQKVLKRYQLAQPYEVSITQKRISVDDRKKQIKERIKKWPEVFTLENTMDDCTDSYDVVVTFLSILDLIHDCYITFTVKKDEVYFKKV